MVSKSMCICRPWSDSNPYLGIVSNVFGDGFVAFSVLALGIMGWVSLIGADCTFALGRLSRHRSSKDTQLEGGVLDVADGIFGFDK